LVVEFDGNIDFGSFSLILANVARFPLWVEIELIERASL
jgi:hypothetical protein